MRKINCNEVDCESNCSCVCKRSKILVEENAICDSFRKRDEELSSYYEEYADLMSDNMKTDLILCESESCVSNENGMCSRSGIRVTKINAQPTCSDYVKK